MFYIVLSKSGYPVTNKLFAKSDVEQMQSLSECTGWIFVPIEVPWGQVEWSRAGGKGKSAYSDCNQIQTIRVPKAIAYEVQKYAVWLWQQKCN